MTAPTPEAQPTTTCDGCGKQAPSVQWADGSWHKPDHWYERQDADGVQIACSRPCIDAVAEATGKTRVILPW